MSESTPHSDRDRRTAFGAWLTEARLSRGLKQQDLAQMLQINSGRISEWETARRVPPPEMVRRLHEVLGPDLPVPPAPKRLYDEP